MQLFIGKQKSVFQSSVSGAILVNTIKDLRHSDKAVPVTGRLVVR